MFVPLTLFAGCRRPPPLSKEKKMAKKWRSWTRWKKKAWGFVVKKKKPSFWVIYCSFWRRAHVTADHTKIILTERKKKVQERIFKNGQNTPCNVSFSSISLKWRKKYTCQIFVKTASVYANLATIRWKGKHHFFTQNQWVDNRCEKYGRNSERTITSRKDIVLTSIQLPCAMAGAKTNREDVSVQRNSHNEILCLPMAKKIEQHSTSFLDPPQITWDPPPNYEASKAFLKECFRHSAPEPKPSPPGRDRRGVSLIRGPGGTITTGLNTNNLAPRDEPPIHPHKLHPNRLKTPETFFRPGV